MLRSMKLIPAALLALALFARLPVEVAGAHGPCACTFPEVGRAGATLHIRSPTYKVIINPTATDFTIEPSGLESAHRTDAPTATLLSLPPKRPRRRAPVRIPTAMPPGVYLILIYDGSEGGSHYTWDYFHVLGPGPLPSVRRPGEKHDSDLVPALIGAGIAAAGAAGLAGLMNRRRERRREAMRKHA